MKNLALLGLTAALLITSACTSAAEARAAREVDSAHLTHVSNVGTTCCDQGMEADLHGCSSPDCCCVTGEDCGNDTCICSELKVEDEGEFQ